MDVTMKTLKQPQRPAPAPAPASHTDEDRFQSAMNAMFERRNAQGCICLLSASDEARLLHLFQIVWQAGRSGISRETGIVGSADIGCGDIIDNLKALAAFTYAWLVHRLSAQGIGELQIVEMIWSERQRQRRLLRENKIAFTCASPIVDARRKFRVLAEEIGEVAEAIDTVERAPRAARAEADHELTAEIVQVAAVAIAWLESHSPEI